MIKPSRGHRASLIIAVAFVVSLARICSAADETHVIYPPLQIFKEFCLDAEWSLEAIAHLAEQHNFALISSEDVPTPDGSPAHKGIWEAKTVIGPIGIIGVEGVSGSHGHTVTCSVTAPLDSTDFMQSWLKSSFGDPTSTLKKPENATEFHWMHTFEDGKIDVILLTRLPGQNSAVLSVMKHKEEPKGRSRND